MDLRLLGPVALGIDGMWQRVGGPRAQAVLALLAVRANEVVTADRLIDQLWGEHPPRAARVALQSYVSRLRGLAAPDTERLLPRQRIGYVLDASVADIDAVRFAELSELGRNQAAAGRWHEAIATLRRARALWHGLPFTGIDEVPALTAERSRLEELSVETRFSELAAELESEGPADVVGSLHHLVDAHPWDERAWRLLMLALYRAGRQTEALEAAARARHRLTEEQGLDPSSELAELEHRILIHHPTLRPPAPLSVAPRRRLDSSPTPLFGRSRELSELLTEWTIASHHHQARLVLVEGEPGVGKSHLVAELARKIEAHGGAVWAGRCLEEPRLPLQPWSDLIPEATVPEPAMMPGGVNPLLNGATMGPHRVFSSIIEQVRAMAQRGVTLLVAEDVHWADSAALRLLDELLTGCARLPLLFVATMRSTGSGMSAAARGVLGELSARAQPRIVRLPGLDATDLHSMLVSRGFQLSTTEIASIRTRTGGVPLLALAALRGGHGVLDARLAGVSDTAATMAELLAVSGHSVPLALLQDTTGLDEALVAAALDELIASGVLRAGYGEPIVFEFTHPLYRETILTRLSHHRRLLLSRWITAAGLVADTAAPPATSPPRLVLAEPADVAGTSRRPHQGRARRRRGR